MPSSPLPIKTLLEYVHLVQGTRYYAMFPKQALNKQEALTRRHAPTPRAQRRLPEEHELNSFRERQQPAVPAALGVATRQ